MLNFAAQLEEISYLCLSKVPVTHGDEEINDLCLMEQWQGFEMLVQRLIAPDAVFGVHS